MQTAASLFSTLILCSIAASTWEEKLSVIILYGAGNIKLLIKCHYDNTTNSPSYCPDIFILNCCRFHSFCIFKVKWILLRFSFGAELSSNSRRWKKKINSHDNPGKNPIQRKWNNPKLSQQHRRAEWKLSKSLQYCVDHIPSNIMVHILCYSC